MDNNSYNNNGFNILQISTETMSLFNQIDSLTSCLQITMTTTVTTLYNVDNVLTTETFTKTKTETLTKTNIETITFTAVTM